jgi:hypothetical protein
MAGSWMIIYTVIALSGHGSVSVTATTIRDIQSEDACRRIEAEMSGQDIATPLTTSASIGPRIVVSSKARCFLDKPLIGVIR